MYQKMMVGFFLILSLQENLCGLVNEQAKVKYLKVILNMLYMLKRSYKLNIGNQYLTATSYIEEYNQENLDCSFL